MIKLFDGDDDQEQTEKGKPSAPYSLNIGADETRPDPPPEPLPDDPAVRPVENIIEKVQEGPAGVGDPLPDPPSKSLPDDPAVRPVENIIEKIQEEPAALRWEETPGPEQEIPPRHTYEPQSPGPREYPPGFTDDEPKPDVFVKVPYEPQSKGDAIRGAGLAWSAGIIFFGSIVFMLILGWGADLLLGSSPWGIVGGIVLGSLIGFIQFFRISSQIFKK
jgi:hypothetical protein